MQKKSKTIFVGMSGGVDSSVAAALLKNQGYNVIGVHLRCYNIDGCGERDAQDACYAAETLGIPFYVFDFEEEYKARVVEYMVNGYRKGVTPNPDVMCNKEIKFGLFLNKARELGADFIATGHYIRREPECQISKSQFSNKRRKNFGNFLDENSLKMENYKLKIAKDKNKDQSYFLWTLTQDQLRHCLFPIGEYMKPDVRKLARKYNLPNAEKKDSQGICFLGQVKLEDFLGDYIPIKRGAVVTTKGEKIAEHIGAHLYTIGQRRLNVKKWEVGKRGTHITTPYYITAKDVRKNTITVTQDKNDPAIYNKEITIQSLNIIGGKKIEKPLEVKTRIRYRQPLVDTTLTPTKKGATLTFKKPQSFVAPGQSAVFYTKTGQMLGGGMIE